MVGLNDCRQIIEKILTEYKNIPYADGDLTSELIISKDFNHYLLITLGWEKDVRVHGCLVHLEIIDNKIWIQRDGIEDGIGNELFLAGIPKEQIVPAFHPAELRQYVKYGVPPS